MPNYPGLELSVDGNSLLASLQPLANHPQAELDGMKAAVSAAGYGGWLLSDEALGRLVQLYNEGAGAGAFVIGEKKDGKFALEIAGDDMAVWLELSPARGGRQVDPNDVLLALGEAGVTWGIDARTIDSVCRDNAVARALVAAGELAIHGEDAHFELLVSEARDRAPKVNEKGLIDFRDLGEVPTVPAEAPLMRRIPATPGKDGHTVRGVELKAKPGANPTFSQPLLGSYVDKEDPNLLRALFSGQPVCGPSGVNVEHVLRLRGVNMATGNIAFDGTVKISGEVLPGMKVDATGDIIVGEVVDGATLEAGGDIRVGGGIIAKASVRAAGAVTVRFVENAQVYAGTTLVVEDTALQADLQANNQILVGHKNPHGRLAGGSARAMLLIQAPILGAPTSGVTQLLLGVNPVLDAKYHDLQQQIEKRKEEEDKLDKLLKHLVKQGDKSGMIERVNTSRLEVVRAWGELLAEREALEKELALVAGARVEIGDSVVGAVDMTFGKKQLRLRKTLHSGVFKLEGEQVTFYDASGNAMSVV